MNWTLSSLIVLVGVVLTTILICLFRYDHQERLTAQESMAHPFFSRIRDAESAAAQSTA
jgi:serine/threonine protein kinase